MDDVTTPPCESCNAHNRLEAKMNGMQEQNNKEHGEILKSLDMAIGNIRWMNIIGKWLLATMLGYFVAIGYYITTNATKGDIDKLHEEVTNGERLHYKNENHISEMNAKLNMITDYIKDKK